MRYVAADLGLPVRVNLTHMTNSTLVCQRRGRGKWRGSRRAPLSVCSKCSTLQAVPPRRSSTRRFARARRCLPLLLGLLLVLAAGCAGRNKQRERSKRNKGPKILPGPIVRQVDLEGIHARRKDQAAILHAGAGLGPRATPRTAGQAARILLAEHRGEVRVAGQAEDSYANAPEPRPQPKPSRATRKTQPARVSGPGRPRL